MILGIDPGLANTGWAVVNDQLRITNYELIACGCLVTKSSQNDTERLMYIYNELEKIIKKYKVEAVALETLFFAKNAKSAIKVSEAIGVIKLCGVRCGLPVFGYTPLQVKVALVGYGRAEKEQVEIMIRNFLKLDGPVSPSHASDAVAVGLTHLTTCRFEV